MTEIPKPWIILYDLKERFEDHSPIKKVLWFFGTKEEALNTFSQNCGYFVDIKYLIPCDHFLEIIEKNNADK